MLYEIMKMLSFILQRKNEEVFVETFQKKRDMTFLWILISFFLVGIPVLLSTRSPTSVPTSLPTSSPTIDTAPILSAPTYATYVVNYFCRPLHYKSYENG